MNHPPQLARRLSPSARSSFAAVLLGLLLMLVPGAARAASADTTDLATRLLPWGLHLTQSTVTDGCLRLSFEDQHGYSPLLAIGLVLRLVGAQAPAAGCVEAVLLAGGKPLVQLRTPTDQVEASLKRSLSRRELAQLRELLADDAASQDSPAALSKISPASAPTLPTALPSPADPTKAATPDAPAEHEADAATIANALVALGLENVQVAWLHGGDLNLQFENRTYRSDVRALGVVMTTVATRVNAATMVRVKALRDEAVLGVFTFRAGDFRQFQGGEITSAAMTSALRADRDTWAFSWPEAIRERTPELSRSRGRVDLLWAPGLEYTIGLWSHPFESTWVLRPELVSTLGEGLRASVRGRVALERSPGLSLDRALLTKISAGASPNLLWTASLGKFRHSAYGGFFEGQWLDNEDRTRLGARLAVLGESPGEHQQQMYTGYLEHEFGDTGLTGRATFGRFLQFDDKGALLEVERRFGESTLRLGSTCGLGERQGLMTLSMPFGPGQVASPKNVRFRLAPAVDLTYRKTTLPVADDLPDAPDLREFRGELTLPYARAHPGRLAGRAPVWQEQRWWAVPSFEGTTGLIRTPTAAVIPDAHFALGYSWLPKDETTGVYEGRSRSRPAFANIGFLPNLELGLRLTFYPDAKAVIDGQYAPWPYEMDRSCSAKYRLFEQRGWRPALAVGTQNIKFGNDSPATGRATYAAASHSWGDVRLHLGAETGDLSGLFGGLEVRLAEGAHLIAEDDTRRVNVGLRLHSSRGLTVDGAWLDGKDFGAAVSYDGKLP